MATCMHLSQDIFLFYQARHGPLSVANAAMANAAVANGAMDSDDGFSETEQEDWKSTTYR